LTRAPPRTESIPRGEYRGYLVKAAEFAATARRSLDDLRLHSAGLEAIHAVISACDALTVAKLELRCKGEDHRDVIQLLRRIDAPGCVAVQRQVAAVLSAKNRVEYGGEGLSPSDAERVVVQSERVVGWVSQQVGD
jgi:HEPN domain-containing protein